MDFKLVEFFFDEDLARFILRVSTPDKERFYKEILVCDHCHKQIDKNDLIYYCRNGRVFFHRSCCISSKHGLKYQRFTNPEHEDHLVILEVLKDGQTNISKE